MDYLGTEHYAEQTAVDHSPAYTWVTPLLNSSSFALLTPPLRRQRLLKRIPQATGPMTFPPLTTSRGHTLRICPRVRQSRTTP